MGANGSKVSPQSSCSETQRRHISQLIENASADDVVATTASTTSTTKTGSSEEEKDDDGHSLVKRKRSSEGKKKQPKDAMSTTASAAVTTTTNINEPSSVFDLLGPIETSDARKAHIVANAPKTKTQLDEDTLTVLKNYLAGGSSILESTLEIEDIRDIGELASRYSQERTRWKNKNQNFVDVDELTAEFGLDIEDIALEDPVYRREEYYVVANEFFKTISHEAQKRADWPKMHHKTMRWIKKAANLQRPYDSTLEHVQHPSDSEGGGDSEDEQADNAAPRRRLTRGMARNTRDKKREEIIQRDNQGVNDLFNAVEDLEKERGKPWPASKRFRKKFKEEDEDEKKQNNLAKDQGTLIAKLPKGRLIKVAKVLVNGRNHDGSVYGEEGREQQKRQLKGDRLEPKKKAKIVGAKSAKSSSKRRNTLYPSLQGASSAKRSLSDDFHEVSAEQQSDLASHSTSRSSREIGELDDPGKHRSLSREGFNDPMSMSSVDWGRHSSKGSGAKQNGGSGQSSRPKEYNPFGVPMEIECPDVITKIPSDGKYATIAKELDNFLGSRGGEWAVHEFFYSDIDRGFFFRDSFAAAVAKLGIKSNMTLSRREWGVIRRHICPTKRRFSKSFVDSEFKKLEKYRREVRQTIKKHPGSMSRNGAVTSPIPIQSIVTAYSSKWRSILRGKVVKYDRSKHKYLIKFEEDGKGTESCPDTDVSSQCFVGKKHVANLITSAQSLKIYPKPTSDKPEDNKNESTIDRNRERQTLASLMATIEKAKARKSLMLDAIEKASALADKHPHSGNLHGAKKANAFRKYVAWLLANLELTNCSLENSMLHLKVMYGSAYSKNKRDDDDFRISTPSLAKKATFDPYGKIVDSFRKDPSSTKLNQTNLGILKDEVLPKSGGNFSPIATRELLGESLFALK